MPYGKCVFCGSIVTIPYGASQARCPKCGAIYGITETQQQTQGFFGAAGHSGEGWWLLGGIIIGFMIGSATGRALLVSALGLSQEEIKRRAREIQEKLEERRARLK
jgi:predicted RNA-binding Zn-ribbon protein involved in translation (DUF1610 family)